MTGSTSISLSKTGGTAADLYSASFDASWEPDVFGATRRAEEAAQADLEATGASLHDTQVSLTAEAAANYVELRGYQGRLKIARENLATQTETLELTSWRAEAGLTSSLDVEQARANREETRAQIPSLETGLAEAEHRLAILLGLTPAGLHNELETQAPIPSVPQQVAVGIPADTLRQRPDIRAAELTLAAETTRLGQAEAARYPSFNLSGSFGLSASALSFGALASSDAVNRSLLTSLTAPIFDRGRIRQQIEIQNAVQEQALVSYETVVLTALKDVEDALVSLANSRLRQEALTPAAEAARNAALLARYRYTVGITDFQTVLDTERTVLSLEDSLVSTQADGTTALIQLYKALGGGWSPDVAGAPQKGDSK